jgi:hypothetical protein
MMQLCNVILTEHALEQYAALLHEQLGSLLHCFGALGICVASRNRRWDESTFRRALCHRVRRVIGGVARFDGQIGRGVGQRVRNRLLQA